MNTRSSDAPDLATASKIRPVFGVRGNQLGYEMEIAHHGLHKHRVLKGSTTSVVQAKANAQLQQWHEQWLTKESAAANARARDQRVRRAAADKEAHRKYVEDQKQAAATRTEEAQAELNRLRGILQATLSRNDAIDWNALKAPKPFPDPPPTRVPAPAPPRPTPRPAPPNPTPVSSPPDQSSSMYQPRLGLLDKLLSSRRHRREAEAAERFRVANQEWEQEKHTAEAKDAEARARWEQEIGRLAAVDAERQREHATLVARLEAEHDERSRGWRAAVAEHDRRVAEEHAAIDALRRRYEGGEPGAIVECCDMVLAASEYPDYFPQEFDLDYNAETRILVVNYALPAPDALPSLGEVKYVASSDSFTEKHLSDAKAAELYDSVVYQATLRTIHELFEADAVGALAAVVFNGFVTAIDKGTGAQVTACIVSVNATRDQFLAINLERVDPKACFRQLKGVGSSKLHSIAPVAPIMTVQREDRRFVASHDVAERLDDGYNLASMDWEEFEHLIREIFGREFSSAGGEVRVTQASRDGGVDAVAFDPDPIRGGKIVIQAKRYTNTVGVSAVRDLYGTVMNEGATKGILVTTADYGPDAYEFAKGKPLSLLNGANLLHLLERHGVKARIDLAEARRQGQRG